MEEALEKVIKPTARKYGTTVKAVRKWVRRYEAEKKAGLERGAAGRTVDPEPPRCRYGRSKTLWAARRWMGDRIH